MIQDIVIEFNGIVLKLSFDNIDYLSWFIAYYKDYIRILSSEVLKYNYNFVFFTEYSKWISVTQANSMDIHAEAFDKVEVLYGEVIQNSIQMYYYIESGLTKAKYCPVRIIRNFLSKILVEEKGYLFMHMAAVENNGYSIAIMGDKFNGKTTSMMNLLCYGNYNYLSNDKIFIDSNNNCYTLPYSIGIRKGTIESNMKLKAKISENYDNFIHYQPFKDGSANERLFLLGDELCSYLDCKKVTNAHLLFIVKCVYDVNIKELRINEINNEEKKLWINKSNILSNNVRSNNLQSKHIYEIAYNENTSKEFVNAIDKIYTKMRKA